MKLTAGQLIFKDCILMRLFFYNDIRTFASPDTFDFMAKNKLIN